MDGCSGYNQIKMHIDDETAIAFISLKGVFCHQVMPFDLKTIRAIYQPDMTIIFKEVLGDTVECYVDDLVIKSD